MNCDACKEAILEPGQPMNADLLPVVLKSGETIHLKCTKLLISSGFIRFNDKDEKEWKEMVGRLTRKTE